MTPDEINAKCLHLLTLPDGWDGDRSMPLSPRALAEAQDLALLAPGPGLGIVPLAEGGVQIEWHRDGYDLEITIRYDAQTEVFLSTDKVPYDLIKGILEKLNTRTGTI